MTAALAVAGWLAGTVLLWRLATVPAAAGDASGVSVVIPARNEANVLPRLLTSLAAQTHRPAEVLVVDDASTEGTDGVAAAAGAAVIRSDGPPPGWTGKTWACHVGAAAATGDRLVFLDADTWLEADALARLIRAQGDLALDGLLSVQPFHVTERPYEQLSATCNVVALMASGVGAADATVAFGPCLVTTPDALAAAGGFEAVRGDVVEDVALARAYRAAGRPVRCLAGGDAVRFRMYPEGWRSLVEGWTKNLAGGARRAPAARVAGTVLWVSGAASVAVGALTAPSLVHLVAWVAFAGQFAWMLRRVGSFRWWTSVLFPVPLAAFVALFARSLVARAVRREVAWRGRRVPVGRP